MRREKQIGLGEALRKGIDERLIRTPMGFVSNVRSHDGHPLPLERAHLILARLIERAKDPDYVSVSWASQEEAAALCPDLSTALDEILKRDPSALSEDA